jgi:mono/diheme cytochrome c family protein
MRNHLLKNIILASTILLILAGCGRERPSEKSPLGINRGMRSQPKYKAYSENDFFADGGNMRMPVAGTMARGQLHEDGIHYTGKDKDGNFAATAPVSITRQLLKRGQERFDIYCSPCHSRLGDGKGIMITRGYLPPPSFHDDRIRQLPDGHIFDVISHGIRNMPSYGHQVPVSDRWAIIAYMRTLQKSQEATLEDIPAELRQSIR